MSEGMKPLELFEANKGLARIVASTMLRRLDKRISKAEAVNAALLGLWDAAKRYDPAKGCKFTSFASYRIRGEILDYIRSVDHLKRGQRQAGITITMQQLAVLKDSRGEEREVELPDHSDPAAEPQANDTIRCLLRVLTPQQRRCVWLHCIRGLTLAETGQATKRTQTAVSLALKKARARMREELQEMEARC